MSGADLVGQEVETFFADGTQHGVGKVVAYTDAPTFVIEKPDGTRESWRADMTKAAIPPVELPTAPRLGWLSASQQIHGEVIDNKLALWQHEGVDGLALKCNGGYSGIDLKWVTDWTPATAVPTEALDELRRQARAGRFNSILGIPVLEFLAAVDEVNS